MNSNSAIKRPSFFWLGLYRLAVATYGLGIRIAAFWNPKARLWLLGRRRWRFELARIAVLGKNWVWVHCASAGEWEDCRTVVSLLKEQYPDKYWLLTFFSPSGYDVNKHSVEVDAVAYLPMDSPGAAADFLAILKPVAALFSRSELWFYYLEQLKNLDIPVYLLALRLDVNSRFLAWPQRHIFGACLHCFTHIFCQNQITKDLLWQRMGSASVTVCGNTRFDRVCIAAAADRYFPEIDAFARNHFLIVAGSTLPKDEAILLSALAQLGTQELKCIIVPHEIEKARYEKYLKNNPTDFALYSQGFTDSHSVLIYDKIGDLKHLYRYADLALVGGGFNRIGIHNVLEPAVWGVKTGFGPRHRNYPEALELLERGYGTVYTDEAALRRLIVQVKDSPRSELGRIKAYVEENSGASVCIASLLKL